MENVTSSEAPMGIARLIGGELFIAFCGSIAHIPVDSFQGMRIEGDTLLIDYLDGGLPKTVTLGLAGRPAQEAERLAEAILAAIDAHSRAAVPDETPAAKAPSSVVEAPAPGNAMPASLDDAIAVDVPTLQDVVEEMNTRGAEKKEPRIAHVPPPKDSASRAASRLGGSGVRDDAKVPAAKGDGNGMAMFWRYMGVAFALGAGAAYAIAHAIRF